MAILTGGQQVATNQRRRRNRNPRSVKNRALGSCLSWGLLEDAARRANGGVRGVLVVKADRIAMATKAITKSPIRSPTMVTVKPRLLDLLAVDSKHVTI